MSQDRPFGISRNPFLTGIKDNMFLDAETAERQVRSKAARGEQRATSRSFDFAPFDGGDLPRAQVDIAPRPEPESRPSSSGRFEFQPFGVELQNQAPTTPSAEAPSNPDEYGFSPVQALKKGFKGLGLTWDFLANRLEKAVTGDTKDTAPILAKSVEEYNQIVSDPRIAQMVKEADQTYDERGLLPAAGTMLGWMVRNPTMVANFITEQIPGAVIGGGVGGVASAPLKSAAVGAAARAGAGKAAQTAVGTGVTGASINTSAVVFQSLGTNYTEGLEKFRGDTEAASDYAVTKTLAEVPANAVAGAFLGINPFKSKVANILNQANIQGVGGAAGAYTAAKAVGEDPSFGEMALEYLGEGLTAPGEIAAVGVNRLRGKTDEQGPKAPPSPVSDRNASTFEAGPGDISQRGALAMMGKLVNSSDGVAFFAAVHQGSDDQTKQNIEAAMARGDRLDQFQQALNDRTQIELGERLIASDQQFTQIVLDSLVPFVSTTPPSGVYKTTPPSLARVANEAALANDEGNIASQNAEAERELEFRAFEREQRAGSSGSQSTGTDGAGSSEGGVSSITTQSVISALQNNVELGRGGNAIVYDIPGTGFVARVPKGASLPTASDSVAPVADPFEGRNFGQPVATVGNVQILLRQEGIPAGLAIPRNLTQEQADAQYATAVNAAAGMPQSAFDQFASDLLFLNERGAAFDPSKSNNVLIDKVDGRFNLVDINQQKSNNYNNSFADMVVTLIGNTYAYRYKGAQDLTPARRQIYAKALAAAQRAGLEIDRNDPSLKYSEKLAGIQDDGTQTGVGGAEVRFTSDPGDGSLWTPEASMTSGDFTFVRYGNRVIAEFPNAPVQTGGSLSVSGVTDLGDRLVLTASSSKTPNVSVSIEPNFIEIQDRDSTRFTRLERGNPNNQPTVRAALGDSVVDAWLNATPDFAIKSATDVMFQGDVGSTLNAGMGRINAAFSDRYLASADSGATQSGQGQQAQPTDSFAQLEASLVSRGAETGSIRRVKNPSHLNKIAKLFGVELFAFTYTGKSGDASLLRGTRITGANGKSIIGINLTKAKDSSLFVLGHEVFHDLARRFPQQAQSLSLEIKAYLQANRYQEYKKFYESRGQEAKTDEEIAADVMGSLFTDKRFWEQLGVRNQPLLARILSVIDNLIASFKAGSDSRQQIKQFLTEYEKVRDMVASFVTETQQSAPSKPETTAGADDMAMMPIDQVRQLLAEKKIDAAAKLFKANNLKAQGFDFTQLVKESGAGRVIGRSVVKSKPAEAQAQSGSANEVPSIRTEDSTQPAASAPATANSAQTRTGEALSIIERVIPLFSGGANEWVSLQFLPKLAEEVRGGRYTKSGLEQFTNIATDYAAFVEAINAETAALEKAGKDAFSAEYEAFRTVQARMPNAPNWTDVVDSGNNINTETKLVLSLPADPADLLKRHGEYINKPADSLPQILFKEIPQESVPVMDACLQTSAIMQQRLTEAGFASWRISMPKQAVVDRAGNAVKQTIDHYAAGIIADSRVYIVDQPQVEFMYRERDGDVYLTPKGAYKPRLIDITEEILSGKYESSGYITFTGADHLRGPGIHNVLTEILKSAPAKKPQPAASAASPDPGSARRVKESEDRLKTANMPGREIVVQDFEAIAQRVRDLFAQRRLKDARNLFNENSLDDEGYTLNSLKEEADRQVRQAERKAREEANKKEPAAENVIRARVLRLMTAGEIGEQGRQDMERMAKADTEDKANQGPKSVDDLEDKGRFADTLFEREDDAEGKADAEAARAKRLSDERINAERRLLKRRAKEVTDNPDVMMGELLNIKSEAQAVGLSPDVIADIFDTPIAQIRALADGLLAEVKSEEELTDVTDETNVDQQPVETGDPITTIAAARNAVQAIKEGLSGGKMTVDQIVRVLQLARKDANFSVGELVYVMEQEGIEIPSVFDRLNGRPFMTPFVEYVSTSDNHALARQAWFNSLDRALREAGLKERNLITDVMLTSVERDLYNDWKQKNTRAPIDTKSKNVRDVFPNSLFFKFTLEQMRNPETIPQGRLPLSVRSGIVDYVLDWYSDVSNALTYRPDMTREILGSLTPQDRKSFTAWRKSQQRAIIKKAQVISRSVDYGNLMGLKYLGPRLTEAIKEQLSVADQFLAKEAMLRAVRIDTLIERVHQDSSLTPAQRKERIEDITYQELRAIGNSYNRRVGAVKSGARPASAKSLEDRFELVFQQEGRTEDGDFVAIDEQSSSEDPFDDDPATRLGDALYRMGNGDTGSIASTVLVQSQVSELMGGFRSAANVTVVGNPSHLPDGVRERLSKRLTLGYIPKGLYDAQTGNIYIFSEASVSEHDTQFTLFHELFGHFGLRAFLGDSYTSYFNSLYNGNKAVREAANRQKEGRNISNAVAVEEALSDMAGEGKFAGVIKGVIGKLIKSLRDSGFEAVANWLSKYTDAEVMYVLRAARDAARNGKSPAFNGAPADVLLSEVRMPYEVYSVNADNKTGAYARYNPVTMQWYVFTPKDGSNTVDTEFQTVVMPHDKFDEVMAEMKRHGRVIRRLRSGLFVDNRIPNDNVVFQDPNNVSGFKRLMYIAAIRAQNEYLPIFKIVTQLEKMGRMADFMNPMKALKVLERKTAARLETEVEQKFVEPIRALLIEGGKKGMDADILNEFLLARFAPIRNEQIAKINPEMPDSGSGMSTKRAKELMRIYGSSDYATELNAIARLLDQMSNDKIDGMVKDGVITAEAGLKMKAAYPFGYVNLSGPSKSNNNNQFDEFVDPLDLVGGRKLNLRGKEKRAMGRGEGNVPTDILARTVAAYEASIIRGEKNQVLQKVLAMFESNPDPSFAMVNTQAFKRVIGEDGMVKYELDKDYINRKDVMVVKVRGIPVTIEFNNMTEGSVGQALHGAVNPPVSGDVITFLRLFNNKIGQMLTTWNPAWAGVNFLRDVQAMYFNAAADGRITKKMARDMLRGLPQALKVAAYMSGWKSLRPDPAWLEAFNQMKESGGLTGFSMRNDLEDKVKSLEMALKGKNKTKLAALGDFIESFTMPFEIATRLSAYKVVSDNGFSRLDAAVFSGEITVDFNARGTSQALRAMYLFFNPAIQGTAKMVRLMRDNPKSVFKYMGALATVGVVTNLLGRALGGQGEDGEDKLDQLPTFKRSTSAVIFPDTPFGAIPLAYGWNAFFAVGHYGADFFLGKQGLATTAKRIGITAIEAFLPAGSSGLESQTWAGKVLKGALPTAIQPVVEWAMNENRYGAPIRMSGSTFGGAQSPESEMAFRSVNPISRAAARGINAATGDGLTSGTRFIPGTGDFNPALLDHFIAAYVPGFGNELYKGAGLMVRLSRGEEIARTPLPLIDRFSAYPPEGFDAGAFRRVARFVDTRWNAYTDTESADEAKAIQAKYPELGRAKEIVAGTQKMTRQLNSEIRFLDNTSQFPEADRVRMINERRDSLKKIYGESIKELSKLGGEYRQQIRDN